MRIAHYIPSIVPARGYGGSERVAYWMAEEQAAAGHPLTMISHEGSQIPFGDWIAMPQSADEWKRALERSQAEIVHFHSLIPHSFPLDFPHLLTVHGNGKVGEVFSRNAVFVSRDHASRHASDCFVYNGIRLASYPLRRTGATSREALFLAKASWRVKNLRGAISISKQAGRKLLVAGGRRPLTPWGITATHARFFGTVDDPAKIALLHRSEALLFPVLWNEPFGIAVIEALACGIPVIASAFGSLPEILSPDCGIASLSTCEMVDFLQERARHISPENCRARVETHFSSKRMAESYLDLYARVKKNGFLNASNPRTLPVSSECILDRKTETSSSR